MAKMTVADLPVQRIAGRRILVRVDFNVPLNAYGIITDDTRILRALPTLRYLVERGGRLVLTSHLGRPKGAVDPALSLGPVADHLGTLLEAPVRFCPDLVGPLARKAVEEMGDGEVLLLENTRFHPGETGNDPELAEALGGFADLFVNDAFGTAHRAHASTVGVAEAIRSRGGEAVAGFLMEKELRYLDASLEDPPRPFLAVLGGAKISGKIDVIRSLLPRVDGLLVGGAMANTFFRALGLETGNSLVEDDKVALARTTLEEGGEKVVLPVDCVVAPEISEMSETRIVGRGHVTAEDRIGDIGEESRRVFAKVLEGAATVVWNGPMGVFELPPFAEGTLAIARSVAGVSEKGGTTVVRGGDSVLAAERAGVVEKLTHVSTGGGASLELLAGVALPGVSVLDERGEVEG